MDELQGLANAWAYAKHDENMARDKRLETEEAILALVEDKTKAVETSWGGQITITRRETVKIDTKKALEILEKAFDNDYESIYGILKEDFNLSLSLNAKGKEEGTGDDLIEAITTKPAKPTFSFKKEKQQ